MFIARWVTIGSSSWPSLLGLANTIREIYTWSINSINFCIKIAPAIFMEFVCGILHFSSGILNGWMIGRERLVAYQHKNRKWSKSTCDLDPTLSSLIFASSVRTRYYILSFFFSLVYSICSTPTRHVRYRSQLDVYWSKWRELKTTNKDHKSLSLTFLFESRPSQEPSF